jgi:hypothetical protein
MAHITIPCWHNYQGANPFTFRSQKAPPFPLFVPVCENRYL